MCCNKAAELRAYKSTFGGAGWRLPSRDLQGSTCRPPPRLPECPETGPRLARPPARPLSPPPPRALVAHVQGTLFWPSPDSPQGGFQRGAESGLDADRPSPRAPLGAARPEHAGLHHTAGWRSLLVTPNAYPAGFVFQHDYYLLRRPAPAIFSAAVAESAATAASAAAQAPVTSCTGSPSPDSGQLSMPPPPQLHGHRAERPRPDWQARGPMANVGRRALTRPLFSSLPFSLNANQPELGVGRGL